MSDSFLRHWEEYNRSREEYRGHLADATRYAIGVSGEPMIEVRPETTQTVKCYLKNREGWTKVIQHRIDLQSERLLYIPARRLDPVNPLDQVESSFIQQHFRLVKSAEIRDYKKDTVRKEAWFEEV